MSQGAANPEYIHANVKTSSLLLWINLGLGVTSFIYFQFSSDYVWPIFSYFITAIMWLINGVVAWHLGKGIKWARMGVTLLAGFSIFQNYEHIFNMFSYLDLNNSLFLLRFGLIVTAAVLVWLPSTNAWYQFRDVSEEEEIL